MVVLPARAPSLQPESELVSFTSRMERASSAMSIVEDDDDPMLVDRQGSKELFALDFDEEKHTSAKADSLSPASGRSKRRKSPAISRADTVEMTDANDGGEDFRKQKVAKKEQKAPGSNGTNYLFYSGQIKSKPMGNYIHEMHRLWFYNYELLESHHGSVRKNMFPLGGTRFLLLVLSHSVCIRYIQWLFPVFESSGVNWDADSLSKDEAKLIREDFDLATKFIQSYRLMLNFYGMVLTDEKTGKVKRHPFNWKSRYYNLLTYQHNFLRVNRILACLGHMGFHRWRKGFLAHLEKEIYDTQELKYCKDSFERFWKKNLDVNTQEFVRKTRELPEDRAESVYFAHMESGSETYQKHLAKLKGEEEAMMPLANEANQRDASSFEHMVKRKMEARERQLEKNKAEKAKQKKESPCANLFFCFFSASLIQPRSMIRRILSKSTPNPAAKPLTSNGVDPTSAVSAASTSVESISPKSRPKHDEKALAQANRGIPGWLRYDLSEGEDSIEGTSEDESDEKERKRKSPASLSKSSKKNGSPSSKSTEV